MLQSSLFVRNTQVLFEIFSGSYNGEDKTILLFDPVFFPLSSFLTFVSGPLFVIHVFNFFSFFSPILCKTFSSCLSICLNLSGGNFFLFLLFLFRNVFRLF